MAGTSRVRGVARSLVAWSVLLSPTVAWGAEATRVQQIGELSGEVAEAVAAEVNVVPFSPKIDARTTPIIVAPGEAFVHQGRPGQVGGLSGAERKAIRQAYDAGQTILLLHASVHDIEALHVLVKEGVTHQSTSDPAVLAYALRQESDIPTVRIVHDLRPSLRAPGGIGPRLRGRGGAAAGPRRRHQRTDPPSGAGCGAARRPRRRGPATGARTRCKPPSSPRLPTVSTTRQSKSSLCTHARKTRITISSIPAVTGLLPKQRSVPRARKRVRYT